MEKCKNILIGALYTVTFVQPNALASVSFSKSINLDSTVHSSGSYEYTVTEDSFKTPQWDYVLQALLFIHYYEPTIDRPTFLRNLYNTLSKEKTLKWNEGIFRTMCDDFPSFLAKSEMTQFPRETSEVLRDVLHFRLCETSSKITDKDFRSMSMSVWFQYQLTKNGLMPMSQLWSPHPSVDSFFKILRSATVTDVSINGCHLESCTKLTSFLRDFARQKIKLSDITTVDLQNNDIRELPGSFFEDVPNLRVLDISKNKIRTLPKKDAQKVTNLTKLLASRNELVNFPKKGFSELEELDLSENKLRFIDLTQPKLRTVNLENNLLNGAHFGASCVALTNLNIRGNYFEYIPSLANGSTPAYFPQREIPSVPSLECTHLETVTCKKSLLPNTTFLAVEKWSPLSLIILEEELAGSLVRRVPESSQNDVLIGADLESDSDSDDDTDRVSLDKTRKFMVTMKIKNPLASLLFSRSAELIATRLPDKSNAQPEVNLFVCLPWKQRFALSPKGDCLLGQSDIAFHIYEKDKLGNITLKHPTFEQVVGEKPENYCIAFHPTRKKFALAYEKCIEFWDFEDDDTPEITFSMPDVQVYAIKKLEYSEDGNLLFCVGKDWTIKVINTSNASIEAVFYGPGPIREMHFLQERKELVVLFDGVKSARIYSMRDKKAIYDLKTKESPELIGFLAKDNAYYLIGVQPDRKSLGVWKHDIKHS